WKILNRTICRYSSKCGSRIGISLQKILSKKESSCHCHFSIWRNCRYPSCIKACQRIQSRYLRNCQCERKFHCSRSGSSYLYYGWTRDCRCDNESLSCTSNDPIPTCFKNSL